MSTPVLLAWSGGKDSSLALAALRADPAWSVVGLLTTVTAHYNRISMHGVRRSILQAQGVALELPVFESAIQPASNNEDYEQAWAIALEAACKSVGPVTTLAYGDLFLEDVRQFRTDLGNRLAFSALFPLWKRDTTTLARQFIADGYEAYLTCVDTTQLAAEFAGRRFDDALLSDLPSGVDPCGEKGEFHTCVVDGPIFCRRIVVRVGERVNRDDRFEYCDLELVNAGQAEG